MALLNFGSKINAITLAYMAQLGLKMWKTNVNAQKIDKSSLEFYSIVITAFQILNKLGCSCFFQETFLLADISMKIVLKIFFLIFSNVDV